MTKAESASRSESNKRGRPVLEFRFQFVDGSTESFVQYNKEQAERTRSAINFGNLFNQLRIVVADDYSKSVFVCEHINRLDLIFEDSGFSRIPADHSDLVELTEEEFKRHVSLDQPARLPRRDQERPVGDPLVSFLKLRFLGGVSVYLMDEIVVKLPADSQVYMQRLLSKQSFAVRLREGGQGFLNLRNLVSFASYPGVSKVPDDSWIADPKRPPARRDS